LVERKFDENSNVAETKFPGYYKITTRKFENFGKQQLF
jgi:hypothetical protein